jgi:hypothetical protein
MRPRLLCDIACVASAPAIPGWVASPRCPLVFGRLAGKVLVLNRALTASILGFLVGEDDGLLGFVAGVVMPVGLHEHGVDLLQIDDFGAVAHGFDERARNHSPPNFPKIVLPFSGRKRRLRLEKMAYNLTARASGKSVMRPKNRVWGFSRNDLNLPLESRRRCPEPRRKSRPTPTFFTPGIPQWPSRDPIEERGGVNLYGFVGNDGIGLVDFLGMLTTIEFASQVKPGSYVPGKKAEVFPGGPDKSNPHGSLGTVRFRYDVKAVCTPRDYMIANKPCKWFTLKDINITVVLMIYLPQGLSEAQKKWSFLNEAEHSRIIFGMLNKDKEEMIAAVDARTKFYKGADTHPECEKVAKDAVEKAFYEFASRAAAKSYDFDKRATHHVWEKWEKMLQEQRDLSRTMIDKYLKEILN